MKPTLRKTSSGYYEYFPRPQQSELNEYYKNKYWQGGNHTASESYTEIEVKYLRHRSELIFHILMNLKPNPTKHCSLLDIGCGEGWDLSEAIKHCDTV